MSNAVAELLSRLIQRANAQEDGHLTIMKFTTNWRVGFGTPFETHEECPLMAVGKTFVEAANAALADPESLTVKYLRADSPERMADQ
jgi:hypothetical protein